MATQKKLLEALDFVTLGARPQLEMLGASRASHFRRVNRAVEDTNVVAVGISEKLVGDEASGELALCFYVRKKQPPSKLRLDQAIPSVVSLPGDSAVFTDVKEIGDIFLETALPQKKTKPLQSGFSIGHFKVSAGTVGAIVRKKGKYFILSNSHVLADSGMGAAGDLVLYPGVADGGTQSKNRAALLADFVQFNVGGGYLNEVDAALAEVDPQFLALLKFDVHGATMPLKTVVAKRGMKVVKSGRTTGKTQGEVLDVNFRVVLPYPGVGKVGFLDQVLCTRYTQPGDSGSLVVEAESGKVVGLHFAGAGDGSVFNPIGSVKKALGFTFVSA